MLAALISGILCEGSLILPAGVFYVFVALAILSHCISRHLTDWFLLLAFYCVGVQISASESPNYVKGTVYCIRSRCTEELPGNHYILSALGQNFYLSHYNTDTVYHMGDSLTFYARISPLYSASNPGEYSYANYLKQKKVFHQLLPCSSIKRTGYSHDVRSFFNRQRDKLLFKTERLTGDTTFRMLIDALCLGYKKDMDRELRDLFITTGTVHLLSVSGLHVGAIYLMILFLFKKMGLSGKKRELSIIPLLWMYACLTGLSPSVVRAATLLSFISIGKALCRTYNPVNSLAAAAFFTLLVQPYALYSLSFLLSYSSYAGIILIYPVIYRLPGTLPAIPSKIYACMCVTIAAQLPTLPISAYYFHTININGFLANLLAVPLATALLYGCAFCLILPVAVGQYLMPINELLYKTLVGFLKLFAPYSYNISGLYPMPFSIVILYGSFIAAIIYILNRKRHWLYATVAFLALLLGYLVWTNLRLSSQREVVVFHYYRQSAILLNHRGYYIHLKNTTDTPTKTQAYILQNKLKPLPPCSGMVDKEVFAHPPYLCWGRDTILISGKEHPTYQPCSILIITDNLYPQQMFGSVEPAAYPSQIIADGSNYKNTAQQWGEFCKEHQIEFRNTAGIGCVRLPIK